jgi:hypothetical protein
MYLPSSGNFTSDSSSLSGPSSASLSSETLRFPKICDEHSGEPDQGEGSLRSALLGCGSLGAGCLVFALLLSGASKLKELIIEVTFKVRHGGKSEEARAKVLYESCSTVLLCIYEDPLREGSVRVWKWPALFGRDCAAL